MRQQPCGPFCVPIYMLGSLQYFADVRRANVDAALIDSNSVSWSFGTDDGTPAACHSSPPQVSGVSAPSCGEGVEG